MTELVGRLLLEEVLHGLPPLVRPHHPPFGCALPLKGGGFRLVELQEASLEEVREQVLPELDEEEKQPPLQLRTRLRNPVSWQRRPRPLLFPLPPLVGERCVVRVVKAGWFAGHRRQKQGRGRLPERQSDPLSGELPRRLRPPQEQFVTRIQQGVFLHNELALPCVEPLVLQPSWRVETVGDWFKEAQRVPPPIALLPLAK